MNQELPQNLQPGSRLEVQNQDVDLGSIVFEAKVTIGPDGAITFVEDVDADLPSFMSEGDADALFNAGILVRGNPDSNKSYFELGSEGHNGAVYLDKNELNNAIKEGRLKLVAEEGGIFLE